MFSGLSKSFLEWELKPLLCSMLNVPQRVLSDVRDGSTYKIRKLADGNCWMVQNLHLGNGSRTYNLTSADSDVTAPFTLPIAQTSGTQSWGWYTTSSAVNSKHLFYNSSSDTGNWYNWYTATAGTGTLEYMGSDVTSSICPKNWQLPSAFNAKSYDNLLKTVYGIFKNDSLYDHASIQRLRSDPFLLVEAGGYWNVYAPTSTEPLDEAMASARASGQYDGNFITSTPGVIDQYHVYFFQIRPNYSYIWDGIEYQRTERAVVAYDGYTKAGGKTVRCVSR